MANENLFSSNVIDELGQFLPATQSPTSSPIFELATLSPTSSPVAELLMRSPTSLPMQPPIAELATPSPTSSPIAELATLSPTSSPVAELVTPSPTSSPIAGLATPSPTYSPISEKATPSPTSSPIIELATPSPTSSPVAELLTRSPTSSPMQLATQKLDPEDVSPISIPSSSGKSTPSTSETARTPVLPGAGASCDARYATPCARTNSRWLAETVVARLTETRDNAGKLQAALQSITAREMNRDMGFYPFVFSRETGECVAHGARAEFVGKTIGEIFELSNLSHRSDADALYTRFLSAHDSWVSYLWSDDGGDVHDKLAYVVNDITEASGEDSYFVGVGFESEPLPLNLPCSDRFDRWCSLTAVRNLVGRAQFELEGADELDEFEGAMHRISVDRDRYTVPEGFYLFMYTFDGYLKAHGSLGANWLGMSIPDIFVRKRLGSREEGQAVHAIFRDAVAGVRTMAWVRYPWRDSLDRDTYTKIALLVPVKFHGELYYLGAGFRFSGIDSRAGDWVSDAPLGRSCSESFNLPCSFRIAHQLSSHSLVHAVSSPPAEGALPWDLRRKRRVEEALAAPSEETTTWVVDDLTQDSSVGGGIFGGTSGMASPETFQTTYPDSAFQAISQDPAFQYEGFYVFAYDFDSLHCVAHGGNPSFVGKTLPEIFEEVQIPLNGTELHVRLRQTAESGGGWVTYDWVNLTNLEPFKKVSYIFQIKLGGKEFYGGIGFNDLRYPLAEHAETGLKHNGDPIPCSSKYGLDCSEINARAILGQALATLTLSSSEASAVEVLETARMPFDEVLRSISARDPRFSVDAGRGPRQSGPSVGDGVFAVSVFSFDDSEACATSDNSGCAVAYGPNAEYVGLTWNEIIEAEDAVTIQGPLLHRNLIDASSSGAGVFTYPYQGTEKRAWAAQLKHEGKSYYAIADYLTTVMGPTCKFLNGTYGCPGGMECTHGDQTTCQPIQAGSRNFLFWIFGAMCVVFGAVFWVYRTKKIRALRRTKAILAEKEALLEDFKNSVVNMCTSEEQYVPNMMNFPGVAPAPSIAARSNSSGDLEAGGSTPLDSDQQVLQTRAPCIQWCWRETDSFMHKWNDHQIEGNRKDRWIKYDKPDNVNMEDSYVQGSCFYNLSSGHTIDFGQMKQVNNKSGFEREVKRVVEQPQHQPEQAVNSVTAHSVDPPTVVGWSAVSSHVNGVPAEITNEPQMVLIPGDIVQISKKRQDGWAYGSKLHLEDEALGRRLVQVALSAATAFDHTARARSASITSASSSQSNNKTIRRRSSLMNVIGGGGGDEANEDNIVIITHDHGWFPMNITRAPNTSDLATLRKTLGETNDLSAPDNWDKIMDPSVAQKSAPLQASSQEYREVRDSFLKTLPKFTQIVRIQRIQNIAMYQSYIVKRKTILDRERVTRGADASSNARGLARFERRWLWHGTNANTIDKIIQQGFNRSFCGKNATMYGKGVYFARDASYSGCDTYSPPDHKGCKYILACSVVVGEYCRGKKDARTPDLRDATKNVLYDSTVDDPARPSLYVTYHDAQCYPDYLIVFKR